MAIDFQMSIRGLTAAVGQLKASGQRLGGAIDLGVRQQAEEMAKQMVQGIKAQAPAGKQFQALAQMTIAIRKATGFDGTKALLRTAALVNSIHVEKVALGAYFVGVMRGSEGGKKAEQSKIAAIHEYGRTVVVRVTPKMRAYMFALMREAGILKRRDPSQESRGHFAKRFMVIKIPARPFVAPVVDKARSDPQGTQAALMKRVAKNLGFGLGGG